MAVAPERRREDLACTRPRRRVTGRRPVATVQTMNDTASFVQFPTPVWSIASPATRRRGTSASTAKYCPDASVRRPSLADRSLVSGIPRQAPAGHGSLFRSNRCSVWHCARPVDQVDCVLDESRGIIAPSAPVECLEQPEPSCRSTLRATLDRSPYLRLNSKRSALGPSTRAYDSHLHTVRPLGSR